LAYQGFVCGVCGWHLPYLAYRTLEYAMLSNATVSELITILKEEFGIECTFDEASESAEELVAYIEVLQEIKHNRVCEKQI
jgi:hypothetical protein